MKKPSKEGEKKNESVCSWKSSVSSYGHCQHSLTEKYLGYIHHG